MEFVAIGGSESWIVPLLSTRLCQLYFPLRKEPGQNSHEPHRHHGQGSRPGLWRCQQHDQQNQFNCNKDCHHEGKKVPVRHRLFRGFHADQGPQGRSVWHSFSGSHSVTLVPRPRWLLRSTVPPCSETTSWTMLMPKPVPSVLPEVSAR